ncbi:MAG TPA: primosomal protein N' [Pyrinomonadaceae bacterium]|nr:primosomal protein N' [Pyrinomonadaceae bacterium]
MHETSQLFLGVSTAPDRPHEADSPPATALPQYAEVAVPVHVLTTFIYRLPSALQSIAQTGSRIAVPFGRKLVTGYIVALHAELRSGTSLKEENIKEAREILDMVPLVTAEILELTRWVSEYYLAPWGQVLKAALPPGVSPRVEHLLTITEAGRAELNHSAANKESIKVRLLEFVNNADTIALSLVADKLKSEEVTKAAYALAREGFLDIEQQSGTDSVRAKYERRVRLLPIVRDPDNAAKFSDAQQRVIEALGNEESLRFADLLARARVGPSPVMTLAKRKLVEIFEQQLRRDPFSNSPAAAVTDYVLTEDQERVIAEIDRSLNNHIYAPFLLHGVTGSGKTEVYIRAMRVALKLGRSALMLVPEIALTPVFSRRLRMHFGEQVAIFHSSLSKGERFDEWTRVRNGTARIVIGTRSAVFAPIQNLGLVIVDEEHESTYRQQDSPHYNARDTAIVRAQKQSAVVVLGSATPSLESFHNASTGKYHYLQLPNRLGDRPLAVAEIIDMRAAFARHQRPAIFSDELLQAIDDTHHRGEQSIILLNRRGYSSFVLCRSCGESIQCPNCDVTLTYHRSERVIICHYCNHREAAPAKCPSCGGKYIYYVGEGTQQIEEKLRTLFPSLRIARIDRDTTSRRHEFEKSLLDFSEGKIDMLVGTQILAKGHDFPNVTLVGVVSVDAGLALPDFRTAERTFQLLTQVAGRAGRGDLAGKVLIQTYHPYHYALQHASGQDYAGFYEEEIRHRQNHSYPPFVALASLLVHGAKLDQVRSDALQLRKELDVANPDRIVRVLGPAPAALARLKNEFRMQLLIKGRKRQELRDVIDVALKAVANNGVNLRSVNVEIDPVSIM